MPANDLGQMITFAVQLDSADKWSNFIHIRARAHDTIRKIAARRGHPEQAQDIARLNGIRSVTAPLKQGRLLKLPGTLAQGDVLHVLAGDPPPVVKAGYAKFGIVDRPGEKGLSQFVGYDPGALDVPIQWESWRAGGDGVQVEREIDLLERLAGRGRGSVHGVGPPPVLQVSVTDNYGNVVPLIPDNWQWSSHNPMAPLYRISNITWDADPKRRRTGYRIQQKAVVEITEYTPISIVVRSSTTRERRRNAGNPFAALRKNRGILSL